MAPCERLAEQTRSEGQPVSIKVYAGAYHSFDSKAVDRTLVVADGRSHRLVYDPSAAADAEARTRAFFDKLLRP